MDISSDSKLIITCSADKNVKIWGLDFGDCHKSIFAHDESVMQVAFEHESHYFWTVGKDKMLKYWDGDKVCSSPIQRQLLLIYMPFISLRTFRSSRAIIVKYGRWRSVITVNLSSQAPMISLFVFGRSLMSL